MTHHVIAWQEFERAAAESTWLPLGCTPGEWAMDVCRFLRDGQNRVTGDPLLLRTLREVTPLAAAYLRLRGGGDTAGRDQETVRRAEKLLAQVRIAMLEEPPI